MTRFPFFTRPAWKSPSRKQEPAWSQAEPSRARWLFTAVTFRPSVARTLHLSSFSVFFLPISPSISSLPVPVSGEGRPSAAAASGHTHTHTVQKTLRGTEWTQDRGERMKVGLLAERHHHSENESPQRGGLK